MIDDGVDLDILHTYTDVVKTTGSSYFPKLGRKEQAWHKSTNGHGTIMANMIVRINPWIYLYVMRIQDIVAHEPGGKARTIVPESAARAITGAISRKVDIISISWTIKKLIGSSSRAGNTRNVGKISSDEKAISDLEKAIDQAKEEKILIVCSAADDIQVVGKNSLPHSRAQDYILHIGSAMPKGQRALPLPDPNSIDYFFPGNQVAEAYNPRSAKIPEYYDGSSVATAFAAGLASLIMYCANILVEYHSGMKSDKWTCERSANWAAKLKHQENLRKAFDNVNIIEHEDK